MQRVSYNKNKKNKTMRLFYSKAAIVIFLIYIILVIINIFPNGNKFSLFNGKEKSKFKVKSIDWLSGKAENDLESYITDRYILGDRIRLINKQLAYALGQHERNGVLLGKDGYLIDIFDTPDVDLFENQISAINTFAKNHKRKVYCSLAIVPTKSDILKSKMPLSGYSADEQKYIDRFNNNVENVSTIDLREVLNKHIEEDIYYKTDSAWTSLGAYYAYNQIANELRMDKSDDRYESLAVSKTFNGNLANTSFMRKNTNENIYIYFNSHKEFGTVVKHSSKDKKPTLYDIDALNSNNQLDVVLGQNKPIIEINSTCLNKDNLVVIGDSYAKSVIPFLSAQYQNIYFVDASKYHHNINRLVQDKDITSVMFLMGASNLSTNDNLVKILD